MAAGSFNDKEELLLTPRIPGGASTSMTKSQRLRINLVDVQSPLSSPTYSPLPSPLKLYADWSQSLVTGPPPSNNRPIDEKEGNAKDAGQMTTSKWDYDYDSLPPALRRKYFSTLERLRLAQKKASPRPKHGPLSGTYKVSISAAKPYIGKDRRPSPAVRPSSRRLQKQDTRTSKYLTSQADAEWFSSLPLKIQRKHFTREERDLLTQDRDAIILDAADEKLYRLGQQVNRSTMSMPSKISTRYGDPKERNIRNMVDPQQSTDVNMKDLMSDSFRWLEDDEDIDLSLDDYRAQIPYDAKPSLDIPPTPKRRPSFRRTFSLSSITFGRNPGSSQKPSELDFPRRTSFSFAPTGAKPANQMPQSPAPSSRPQTQQRSDAIDPLAKHYQDPEARRKLRVYLASPQKFDEAIEFGFPSLKGTIQDPARPNLNDTKRATDSIDITSRSFLEDDAISLPAGGVLDVDHDDTSIADSDSPKTPDDFQQKQHEVHSSPLKRLPTNSPDNVPNITRPRLVGMRSEPYAKDSLANREMTLHMTLTRPDLRTTSEDIVPPNKMPLKLAELPVADEAATVWDTLPVETGKMKKMWKRLTKK